MPKERELARYLVVLSGGALRSPCRVPNADAIARVLRQMLPRSVRVHVIAVHFPTERT